MEEFASWPKLATVAGATVVTKFLVDVVKAFVPLQGKQTLGVSCLIGVGLILLANSALGTCKPLDIPVHIINGLVVGLAASGFNDAVERKK